MNEIIKNIRCRRSVRKFSSQPISEDDLHQIADCARFAPSAVNRQLCNFTVVANPQIIEELAQGIRNETGRDKGYNFYGPSALIIVSGPKDSRFSFQDGSCAMQNIFLAAESLGIGSVWINQLCDVYDAPDFRKILTRLGIPENHLIVGTAALGYPDVEEPFYEAQKRSDSTRYVL